MATMQCTAAQRRFKEEQAVSPRSEEGCFCFDMWVPAVTYLLQVRVLKPSHLIPLSWSPLNGFPEVCSAGCGAWCKQLASLVPENNHDKLHLLYGKPGETMGSHSETAGHVTGETLVKARICSVHGLRTGGHNHPSLLSWAFLWFQTQGCQEQLQECRPLNSEREPESKLWAHFTPVFQLAPLLPFQLPMSYSPEQRWRHSCWMQCNNGAQMIKVLSSKQS